MFKRGKKLVNLNKLNEIAKDHFKRNPHISIRDADNILRMLIHMFEQIAQQIPKHQQVGKFAKLQQFYKVTP